MKKIFIEYQYELCMNSRTIFETYIFDAKIKKSCRTRNIGFREIQMLFWKSISVLVFFQSNFKAISVKYGFCSKIEKFYTALKMKQEQFYWG